MFLLYVYKKIKTGVSCNRWLSLILYTLYFLLINLFIVQNAYPAQATLSWNAPTTKADGSPLTNLAGYKVYYGTASGNYTNQINVGNVLTHQINTLSEGFTYYFTTTAYDTSGNESGYSNEASKTIPSTTQYTLTVIKSGTGTGTVTSSPAGINCGADCSEIYSSGTSVTLTASASTGSSFSGWSGGCSATTGNTCITTMSAARSITATFTATACTYTITPVSASYGSLGGTGSVNVTSQSGCSWSATIGMAWVSITSGSSGTGNGTVNYSVSANTGASRTGTMTIGGKNFSITQSSAAEATPKISVSTTYLNFGSLSAGSTSAPYAITVKNTGVSDLIINTIEVKDPVTGLSSTDFSQTNNCSIVVQGGTCTIDVTFKAMLPFGKKTAVMKISSNDPRRPELNIKLGGESI